MVLKSRVQFPAKLVFGSGNLRSPALFNSMNLSTLKALEFDRVIDIACSFAVTSLGAAQLKALIPQSDPKQVAKTLAATTEGVGWLSQESLFPLKAPTDLEKTLAVLSIEGQILETQQLLGLAEFVASANEVRKAICTLPRKAFPILHSLATQVRRFDAELKRVSQLITVSGEIIDSASPTLQTLRERLHKQRFHLRNTMESYIRNKETGSYLQENIVTDRNGRFVLVVKTAHRKNLPGIVHGSSSSGASLFLEPLNTVDINNDIVALVEQEQIEIRKILLGLTDIFRERSSDLNQTIDAITKIDVIHAKACFSRLVGGIEPTLSTDGTLELRSASHPLLMPAVRERLRKADQTTVDNKSVNEQIPSGPVPVNLLLIPPITTLVITGPNTGGKTVALKTAGLVVLMAQAGLHVPAATGSRVPVFRSMFTDIGDEQSISANLSTFSWHITNIAAMDRSLTFPALLLLDEIGAGTDPAEGGALGAAIVDHFRRRGAQVMTTTHYEALKSYASTTDGVTCAGFGFDAKTYAPTYVLRYGSPGRSLALEISARLGLAPSIVAAAKTRQTTLEIQLSNHLERLEQDLRTLDDERHHVAQVRDQLVNTEMGLRARETALTKQEAFIRAEKKRGVDTSVREAKREIDLTMREFKKEMVTLTKAASSGHLQDMTTGIQGAARVTARKTIDTISNRFQNDLPNIKAESISERNNTSAQSFSVGDHVIVESMGFEGVVTNVAQDSAEVDIQGKRLLAPLGDLRMIDQGSHKFSPPAKVSVQLPELNESLAELNVIGCTIDEALTRTEAFLDKALLADQSNLRVIHGHGTGRLRRAIANLLDDHRIVERYYTAPPEEGGGGVTVVTLKD